MMDIWRRSFGHFVVIDLCCLGLLLFGLAVSPQGLSQSVTLAWDPNPEPDVAGYRLYSGGAPGEEELLADVGNRTTAVVTNLLVGVTNYFYVTAYNTSGVESVPSNEISYRVPTLSEAVGAADLLWAEGGGAASWYGQTSVSYGGGVAARSGAIGANQSTWMEASVMGPGSLSCWWRASSEANYDYLRVRLGEVEKAKISGETGWLPLTISVPPGWQTIRWIYSKDQYVVRGLDAGWVDEVDYVPSLALADVLNTSGWSWTAGGDSPGWFGQTAESRDGFAAARSGTLGNRQTNWIATTVTGPGTLTFWWKVSSERNYDFLRFAVDGVEQAKISGEVGWTGCSYTVGSGARRLQWAYTKDPYVVGGSDAAWLDQVAFVPNVTLAAAPARGVAPIQAAEAEPTSRQRDSFVRARLAGEDMIRVTLAGLEGERYLVETSEDLARWIPVRIVVVGAGGTAGFEDAISTRSSARFYRWQSLGGVKE